MSLSSLPCVCQAEEAREHCRACQMDVGVKRADMAATKSLILSQLREMVFQCDLTLKAVSPVPVLRGPLQPRGAPL